MYIYIILAFIICQDNTLLNTARTLAVLFYFTKDIFYGFDYGINKKKIH